MKADMKNLRVRRMILGKQMRLMSRLRARVMIEVKEGRGEMMKARDVGRRMVMKNEICEGSELFVGEQEGNFGTKDQSDGDQGSLARSCAEVAWSMEKGRMARVRRNWSP